VARLETIGGIGPVLSEKLTGAGVTGIEDLLEKGATKQGRSGLAESSGVSETLLLKFVNHADLMRVKGIGGEYSELLEQAGVGSSPELAQRNAANLSAKIEEINAEKKLVRSTPSESQIQDWVDQAKDLPKVVQH